MTENKTEQELVEKIALKLKIIMPTIILDYINNNKIVGLQDCEIVADQILTIVKEAGWKSPEEVQAIYNEFLHSHKYTAPLWANC